MPDPIIIDILAGGGRSRRTKTPKAKTDEALEFAIFYDGEKCILWPHPVGKDGYPQKRIHGKRWRLNRYICEMAHGPAPSSLHEAAHCCGVRRCLNKKHLRWATPKENAADRFIHGTQPIGDAHHNTKISDKQVEEILKDRRTHWLIARDFGVDRSTISLIKRGGRKGMC